MDLYLSRASIKELRNARIFSLKTEFLYFINDIFVSECSKFLCFPCYNIFCAFLYGQNFTQQHLNISTHQNSTFRIQLQFSWFPWHSYLYSLKSKQKRTGTQTSPCFKQLRIGNVPCRPTYDLNLRLHIHSKLEPVEVMGLRHLVLRIPFPWDLIYVTGQSVPTFQRKSKTFKSFGFRGVLCKNQLCGSLSPMHGVSSDRGHKPTELTVDNSQ